MKKKLAPCWICLTPCRYGLCDVCSATPPNIQFVRDENGLLHAPRTVVRVIHQPEESREVIVHERNHILA